MAANVNCGLQQLGKEQVRLKGNASLGRSLKEMMKTMGRWVLRNQVVVVVQQQLKVGVSKSSRAATNELRLS